MRKALLICGFFFGLSVTALRAGSVVTLADSPEAEGKLTLNSTAIHVESASPEDINLADVLEADFNDTDFHLDGLLPVSWKRLDVGPSVVASTGVYADGALTLTGPGTDIPPKEKPVSQYSFVGEPWTGNGQWTVRVKEIDSQTPQTEVGLMLRDGLDAQSSQVSLGATAEFKGRALNGPMAEFRWNQAASPEKKSRDTRQPPVSIQLPVWLRLTLNGDNIDASTSSDGKAWGVVGQYAVKAAAAGWIGFFLDSHQGNVVGKAVLDQISFVPGPCATQVVPAGVLLRSGSFLAGSFATLNLDPANPDTNGNFRRKVRSLRIPASKIATVVIQPTTRTQIMGANSQVGLIMKNGDFLDGNPQAVGGSAVRISSLVLGIASYPHAEVSACVLHPLQPQASAYEIRLKDGSIIRASSISGNNGEVVIEEVSGLSVSVAQDEIAQFRAGPAQVQSLIDLPWTSTPPPSAPAAPVAPATNNAPAAPVASVTNAAPPANPAPAAPVAGSVPDEASSVECWEGTDRNDRRLSTQRQISRTGRADRPGARCGIECAGDRPDSGRRERNRSRDFQGRRATPVCGSRAPGTQERDVRGRFRLCGHEGAFHRSGRGPVN